jgi:hypothetical protein
MNLSKIDKAHILALLGIIGTGAAAIIPSESGNIQAVIVALGGGISALYPIVKAIEKLAESNVSPQEIAAEAQTNALAVARSEIGKVDFSALVKDAVDAKSLPDLEAMVETKARQVLAQLLGQAAQTAPPAALPAVPTAPVQTTVSSTLPPKV